MIEGFITIVPDKEKAKSVIKMADTTLKMIGSINQKEFPSNAIKEYYEVLREFISVVLLLDGLKVKGEGAHKNLIDYLGYNYKEFNQSEISLLDDLRTLRNRISYDGFFVSEDYLERRRKDILHLIEKARNLSLKKLTSK